MIAVVTTVATSRMRGSPWGLPGPWPITIGERYGRKVRDMRIRTTPTTRPVNRVVRRSTMPTAPTTKRIKPPVSIPPITGPLPSPESAATDSRSAAEGPSTRGYLCPLRHWNVVTRPTTNSIFWNRRAA